MKGKQNIEWKKTKFVVTKLDSQQCMSCRKWHLLVIDPFNCLYDNYHGITLSKLWQNWEYYSSCVWKSSLRKYRFITGKLTYLNHFWPKLNTFDIKYKNKIFFETYPNKPHKEPCKKIIHVIFCLLFLFTIHEANISKCSLCNWERETEIKPW